MNNTFIYDICQREKLSFESCRSVTGGDINEAWLLNASGKQYFLKVNAESLYPLMFEKEAEGLKALGVQSFLKVPEIVALGRFEDRQYLVLEWLENAPIEPAFWEAFAQGMSTLHRITNPSFGWSTSNYIGSLLQHNDYKATWAEFYVTQRLMPLVESLFNKTIFAKKETMLAEKLGNRLNEIFPLEPPSLLHGDLWSGNFMAAFERQGERVVPAVFDPAVYYGHREMDLGMTLLFGGFNSRFYESYHSFYPLEKNWKKRVALTQLYPLLVHALLFGGGYIDRCKTILRQWGN